jgi:surface protein
MEYALSDCPSFNADLSAWDVSEVTTMESMFYGSALDHALGWCVENDVDVTNAFGSTSCSADNCGITIAENCDATDAPAPVPTPTPTTPAPTPAPTCAQADPLPACGAFDLDDMVDDWLDAECAASAEYGHIAVWDTSCVTDMSRMFQFAATQFDDDVGDWDTSKAVWKSSSGPGRPGKYYLLFSIAFSCPSRLAEPRGPIQIHG